MKEIMVHEVEVWFFDIYIYKENQKVIDHKLINEFVDAIITWVECNDCQIGGGPLSFMLESADGSKVKRDKAEQLLTFAKRWAEKKHYLLKGTFKELEDL